MPTIRGQKRPDLLANDEPNEWFAEQVAALHYSYLLSTPPQQIADELRRLRSLTHGEVKVWHRYLPETKTCEFTIGTFEDITPGVFHKLTGGLTSAGLQILSAEISTLADGLVLDRFRVHDPDYSDEPPPDRLADVARRVTESLVSGQVPVFRRIWQSGNRQSSVALQVMPTRVRLDNSTSEGFTIVDVFASDQMGLLFTITRTLFELGLSVSLAKIGDLFGSGRRRILCDRPSGEEG